MLETSWLNREVFVYGGEGCLIDRLKIHVSIFATSKDRVATRTLPCTLQSRLHILVPPVL